MRFNAYLYVIIWTIGIGFNLLAIFWPKFNMNPTLLVQQTLASSPFIDFNIGNNNTEGQSLIGPFLYWDGRSTYVEEEGDVELTPPQTIWRIYGKYMDYKKYLTYEQLLNNGNIIKKDLECKEGFKNCGIIDTLNQQLCLPKNISCPLNDIEIINQYETLKLEEYYDKGYEIIFGKNDKAFAYTNQSDNPVIGRILLNGDKACANSYEISWESLDDDENNSTKECKHEYKGNYYDETYSEFGKISYHELYSDNFVDFGFIRNFYKTRYFYLFKNKFIGIDLKCLKDSNIHDVPNTKDMVDFLNMIWGCSIGFGVINFVLIILIIVCDLFLDKYSDEKNTWAMNIPERFYIAVNSIVFVIYIISYKYFAERNIDFDCSDEIVNDQISQLNKRILVMKISTLGYSILYISFLIVAVCRMYYSAVYDHNIFEDYFSL